MKKFHVALLVMGAFLVNNITAEEIDEVIVTSSFIDQALSDIENPLQVVDGEDISTAATQSLGGSIDGLLGVSSADYGSAVGQPVIRGMSGSRVKVLHNGRVVRDVSGLGADHVNDIDLTDIQQIEVAKGPSSLFFSNGSIGGIINIVDNTIAKTDFTQSRLAMGAEAQSVNDGDAYDVSYQNNLGGLNLSLAYKDSQFGNFDIPDGAVLHEDEHDEHEGEEHHDEEEHDEDEHGEEHEEQLGYLPNSDYGSTSKRIGLSKTGDWGYVGISANSVESVYGIPFHGDNHEDHEGEEHEGEEHGEEEHEGEEHADEHEGEHEGERIFSNTKSDVFNLEGSYKVNKPWLTKVDYFFRDSDYLLTEQHAEEDHDEHVEEEHGEEEHEDEHHEEGPTMFKNEAKEYGAVFDLTNDTLSQKLVLNLTQEDISIMGAEAFMSPTDNEETSIGYYLSNKFGPFHVDFGVRHDMISRSGSLSHDEHEEEGDHEEEHDDHAEEGDHEEELELFDRDLNNTSFALSVGTEINALWDFNIGLSRVVRAPSAVELFMNGPHLATGRLETGNPNLKAESSNNIDLTLSYENAGFYGDFTLFQNNIDDYIYLMDETEDDHAGHDDHDDHGGLILANYLQRDAEFSGYELEFGQVFELDKGEILVSFGRDSVTGEFADGSNIPRLVPARNIYSLSYSESDLELSLRLKDVERQNDIGEGESVTDGFKMLNLSAKKSFNLNGEGDLTVSVFANNLLDEVARNHSSFVKNEVPLAGRNLGLKIRAVF